MIRRHLNKSVQIIESMFDEESKNIYEINNYSKTILYRNIEFIKDFQSVGHGEFTIKLGEYKKVNTEPCRFIELVSDGDISINFDNKFVYESRVLSYNGSKLISILVNGKFSTEENHVRFIYGV